MSGKPIGLILGAKSGVIENFELATSLTKIFVNIGKAADRATGQTRQLRSFSRRRIIEVKPIDVNELLAGLGILFHSLLPANFD
jgi:hypothetical protein